MPRENSFSDEGRSLTPDLDEEPGVPQPPATSTSPHQERPISPKSPTSARHDTREAPRVQLSPGDKFRSAVRKVIQLHRSTTILTSRGIGAEPGVDPRRHSATVTYGHIREDCEIEVFDYSSVRTSSSTMTNKEFVDFLDDPETCRRPSWSKVRWINIGGVSWDVISALALTYRLHPLALEDVLHHRDQNRSKMDYYQRHLFIRVLSHSLAEDEFIQPAYIPPVRAPMTDLPRSESPTTFTEVDKDLVEKMDEKGFDERLSSRSSTMKRRGTTKKHLNPFHDVEKAEAPKAKVAPPRIDIREERMKEAIQIDELKKGERVNVKVSPIYIFLLRDGTLITIHRNPRLEFTQPIMRRLRQRDTLLRASADPSLLLQSILDLLVDQAMEVVDEYQGRILKIEHQVLLKPKMRSVRYLHILSGDLILHKRTLEPIKTLVYGLRRYDLDRCAALIDQSTADPNVKVVGYMSHKAKIYLADVHDHMEYILTSLDMFSGVAENLINYTFNMASYQMNEVMRRLTLVTIIFFPLTLLTGYFGMNFENMWSIHHNHSDIWFWIIAFPLMAIVVPLFLQQDLIRMYHYIEKRIAARNAVKTFKMA